MKKRICLNSNNRECPLIVSLTSFPGRINTVYKTIQSVLLQEPIKADRIQLWLAEDQFPDHKLPDNLINLIEYGLEVAWCENIRSYKKLIPCLEANPNSIIVTADDDVYYSSRWLTSLYKEHLLNPNTIICHKATMFYLENGKYQIRSGGREYYHSSSYLNKLVGVGGVLYPPDVLYHDVSKKEFFQQLAPTNDDIWFWFMGILRGTKVKVVKNNEPKPIEVYEHVKSPRLTDINDGGELLFWSQFNNLILKYPEVDQKLKNECSNQANTM